MAQASLTIQAMESLKDVPNGIAGLDGNAEIVGPIKVRDSIVLDVPVDGEIVRGPNGDLRLGDNITENGHPVESLIKNANGSLQLDTAGDARGAGSVDMQSVRTNASQVASGARSLVVGETNTVSANNSIAFGKQADSAGRHNSITQGVSGYGQAAIIPGYTQSVHLITSQEITFDTQNQEILFDGQQIIVSPNTGVIRFDATITVAHFSDIQLLAGSYIIDAVKTMRRSGLISRYTDANPTDTTTLSAINTEGADITLSGVAWAGGVTFAADQTTGALKLTVTGPVGAITNWSVDIHLHEMVLGFQG